MITVMLTQLKSGLLNRQTGVKYFSYITTTCKDQVQPHSSLAKYRLQLRGAANNKIVFIAFPICSRVFLRVNTKTTFNKTSSQSFHHGFISFLFLFLHLTINYIWTQRHLPSYATRRTNFFCSANEGLSMQNPN